MILIMSCIIFSYTLISEWYVRHFDIRNSQNVGIYWPYKLCAIFITSISGPLLLPYNLDYTIRPCEILLSVILHIVLTDILFYHIHKYFHKNKFLYNNFHIYHHMPKYMESYIATYEHPIETIFARVTPFLTWTYLFTIFSSNIISWLISVLTVIFITIVGHSGYKPTHHVLYICPFLLILRLIPETQNGLEHEMHHKYYNCNYSSFLRIWDDYYSTTYKGKDIKDRDDTSIVSCYTRIMFICLCLIFPIESIFLYCIRELYLIMIRRNINEKYYEDCIYGYHPHGIISLPAFLTFAWGKINTVFAVRDSIMWIPGTCSVGMSSLSKMKGSVAIALDGRIGLDNRIIKRKGFCTLGKRLCPCIVLNDSYDIVFGEPIEYEEDTEALQEKYYSALNELSIKYQVKLVW